MSSGTGVIESHRLIILAHLAFLILLVSLVLLVFIVFLVYLIFLVSYRGKKKPDRKLDRAFNDYGSYLLSRIVVQYHRP